MSRRATAPGAAAADQGFVGRHQELAAIAAAAASAARSQARVVWIEGDPGSGKTALLRRALAALPEGFSVTRAEADELTSDAPFSLVSQLGVVGATAAFPAGLELLERWGQRQEQGPVAVVIEDLQWADPQSRLALLGAVRRLGQDRVLALVTSRPGPDVADGWDRLRLDADRCVLVRLGSLPLPDVAAMARRAGLHLPRRAAERLFGHTGGHPLYVKTLLSELSPERLAAPEGRLPVPRSLASTTIARLAGLPGDARSLAAGLAVINQPTSLPVVARVAGVDQPAQALDSLLATGFVTWQASDEQPALQFAHPLYREAIYADLAPTRRQELHRRAADIVGGRARLGHRVAAADRADDALADQADDTAEEEASRSDFAVAAKHLLWASQLSSDRSRAERRLLRAARLLLAAEQTAQAESLRSRLEDCAASPLRALVLGVLAWDEGDAVAAEQLLAEAAGCAAGNDPGAVAEADRMATAEAWARLAFLYAMQIRPGQALDAASRAFALAPPAEVEHTATLAAAAGEAILHGAPAGLRRLAQRLPAAPGDVEVADVDLLIARGSLNCYAGRTVAAVADLRAAVRLARQGPAFHLPRAHIHLSQQLFDAGDWDEALVQARVALSLIPDERRTWIEAQADGTLASVLASRGEWDRAQEHLAAAERVTAEVGIAEAEGTTRAAQASWARARHQPEGVIEALGPMLETEGRGPSKINSLVWWPWLIAALIDHGQIDTAALQVEELHVEAAQRGLDLAARIAGLRARLSAATGDPDRALADFRRAVGGLGPNDPLLDRAELHHAFGRLLRARGDRREAVGQLRQAHELLSRVGARPFVQRVEADLGGTGLPATAGVSKSPLALTDRERDVVALVAKGLTNREVAGELYFSVKAVEYHLGNVFGKLGISSRRQLRELAVPG